MHQRLAFVLGGGGSRGALQVGALRALCEFGLRPDLLIGTSAGAINAAFVALHGFSPSGLAALAAAWQKASALELLPSNYVRLTLRAMLRPSASSPSARIRDFFIENGIRPASRFADIVQRRLIIVSSDLNTGRPVLHGLSLADGILDALLVSTALPPWVMPVRKRSQYLMDGALVSNLPIEPALQVGATRIIALDLLDARGTLGPVPGPGMFLNELAYAVQRRQVDLELELAQARGVAVEYLSLTAVEVVPIWDFRHTGELIARGYALARSALDPQEIGQMPHAASM